MLFHMYQVFSFLLGHLHFSVHFFFTFMEQLFKNHLLTHVISKRFELQQRDCAQMKGLSKQITKLIKFLNYLIEKLTCEDK